MNIIPKKEHTDETQNRSPNHFQQFPCMRNMPIFREDKLCFEAAGYVELMLQFSAEEKVDFYKMTPEEYTAYYVKLVNDYDEYHPMYPSLVKRVIHVLTEL